MQVNIVIASKDSSDKKLNTTISWVSETATNNQLLQLASSLNALTDNTYQSTTKETKETL